ncbi:MAG TPA: nucleotidyltransferase family protein [Planctomycetaceae bacterium]
MSDQSPAYAPDDPDAVRCYRQAMRVLRAAEIEFLVGGAYSFARYTAIPRHTKDLDLFIRPEDRDRALTALAAVGFRTEVTYSHWLAKAFQGDYFIDLIYSSGNAVAKVDDSWFEHAVEDEVMGEQVRLCPPEESIWSKAFIMERHRFDGADVCHMLRDIGDRLDWRRLLDRFGDHWRVLYSHIVLFGYVYPGERDRVPAWVIVELTERLVAETNAPPPEDRLCRGTLLSAAQYLPDVERWGYRDGRLSPDGTMTATQAAAWTEGVLSGR